MRKQKGIALGLAMMLVASMACADIYVDWSAGSGFFWSGNSSVGILGDGTGNSTLVQLIWSSDAVASAASASTAHYVTDGEVWLADWTVMEDGVANDGSLYDSYALFSAPTYQGADQGVNPSFGYVYARIFQDDSVALNDWYYVSPIVALQSLDPSAEPPPNAQEVQMNRDLTNGDAINGDFGAQVVPEPATFALFAIGAVIMRLRRRG